MSAKFKDKHGNSYVVSLTLGRVREIREKLDVDVTNPAEVPELVNSLATRLAYVWYLIEPQAAENGIDCGQWESDMMGEGIADKCSDAFLSELADFTQSYGQTGAAATIRQAVKGLKKIREATNNPAFRKKLEEQMNAAADGLVS